MTNTQSFRSAEGERPKKYSQFVQAGTGNTSIWDDLQAQSLLGVEGFAEGLRHLVTEKQQIREIAKGQRFVGRPSLEKLFSQRSRGKASRDRCHQAPYRRIQMPARQIPDPYRSLFSLLYLCAKICSRFSVSSNIQCLPTWPLILVIIKFLFAFAQSGITSIHFISEGT